MSSKNMVQTYEISMRTFTICLNLFSVYQYSHQERPNCKYVMPINLRKKTPQKLLTVIISEKGMYFDTKMGHSSH